VIWTVLSLLLMIIGGIFAFLAGIGILRLPDMYIRMSATTKTATLGIGCILLATAIFFSDTGVTFRAAATILFLFLTAPVAAHMIGRAAYLTRVPLWEGTVIDELQSRYDPGDHTLASSDDDAPDSEWFPEQNE
jgi:multicomponent Na+:H+ antiporter subunit G